jgi:hypothetical protein
LRSAIPTWLDSFMPPIPGPWPARGSKITNGRLFGSVPTPRSGLMRSSM